ncbi:O-antigen ligase family protein [Endozoicomonas sp. SM1973]|uniref:O-antigen ligase family protein n=1 Tax=Spartinivicinus marinus TaxID=2994442 RepID=A0A853HXW2_9GAMM|nr:O-antigen ligase family protein [Spartinivicinus marinus]MCX4026107.1 O-antigen ligase family protein [Spartinivicinus marinus]NYZ66590.1 O-antigen ligase family protein [Spartinivicinus marinus]
MNRYNCEVKSLKGSLVTQVLTYMLLFGIFIFFVGVQLFPTDSKWHTQLYIFLYLPVTLLIFLESNLFFGFFKEQSVKLLTILLCYFAISSAWGSEELSFGQIKKALMVFLFIYAVYYLVVRVTDIQRIAMIAVGLAALTSLYSIYNYGVETDFSFGGRFVGLGILSNPLLSSHYFGFLCVFSLGLLLLSEEPPKKVILLLCVVVFFVCTFLTKSRTPLVGFFGVILVLLIITFFYKRKTVLKTIFYILVTLLTIVIIAWEDIAARGVSHRPEIWSEAIKLIFDELWLGYGLGAEFKIYLQSIKQSFYDPHNIHLGILYHFGFVGFLGWVLTLFLLTIKACKKGNYILTFVGLPLLVYGVFGGISEGGNVVSRPKEVWYISWVPIALTIAFISCSNQNKITKKQSV